MSTPTTQSPPSSIGSTRLTTVFLTGPGGLVYEIPEDVAERYVVTPERLQELGHLPITPYGSEADASLAMDEVQGRHQILQPTGLRTYHGEVRFGAFLWTDGHIYVGDHYHPYGSDLALTP